MYACGTRIYLVAQEYILVAQEYILMRQEYILVPQEYFKLEHCFATCEVPLRVPELSFFA